MLADRHHILLGPMHKNLEFYPKFRQFIAAAGFLADLDRPDNLFLEKKPKYVCHVVGTYLHIRDLLLDFPANRCWLQGFCENANNGGTMAIADPAIEFPVYNWEIIT